MEKPGAQTRIDVIWSLDDVSGGGSTGVGIASLIGSALRQSLLLVVVV